MKLIQILELIFFVHWKAKIDFETKMGLGFKGRGANIKGRRGSKAVLSLIWFKELVFI